MKGLVTLAASRPSVSLALGYTPLLLLVAVAAGVQSGLDAVVALVALNAGLALLPIGCVALAGRLLGGARPWWMDRLVAVAAGLLGLVLLALGGVFLWDVPPLVAGLPAWVALPAVVACANVPPLLLGVGVEALARRFAPSAG